MAIIFFAAVVFVACSNDVEDSMPVPAKEEEAVINDNPYAVTIDEAEKILEQFLANENEQVTKGGGVAHQRRIKSRYTTGGNKSVTRSANGEEVTTEEPVLHIFNFENNEGFAVMGGDRRGAPMLALTESGELTPGMTIDNPGMASALAHAEAVYRQMIVEAGCDTVVISNGTATVIMIKDSLVVNRHGACQTLWHQSYPFNMYCAPNYSGMNNYSAGCVAIAVAQIMAFHKYPSSYGGYTFNWDNMIANTTANDVAALVMFLNLPANLNTQPGPNGSSSNISLAPQTFQNFGYSNPGICTTYNTDIILNCVMLGQPVLIQGSEPAQSFILDSVDPTVSSRTTLQGHAWVGDGGRIITSTMLVYNHVTGEILAVGPTTTKYVHCNFGWELGLCNGLYLSEHYSYLSTHKELDFPYLIPREIFNYNTNLAMVVGISQ